MVGHLLILGKTAVLRGDQDTGGAIVDRRLLVVPGIYNVEAEDASHVETVIVVVDALVPHQAVRTVADRVRAAVVEVVAKEG